MNKSVVLAEKPSVARDLARVLKCKNKRNGFFEGREYVVTWALGHLVTLAEPGDYAPEWKEWKTDILPMIPDKIKLKVIPKSKKQFNIVRNLLKRKDIDEVIIAADAGREGELVARWIMILGGWKGKFRRLWISSQTDKAILDGFKNLKPGKDYDSLFYAAQARAEADWIMGLNVTRCLTCKFDTQLTAGRVQTPVLAMIVNREKEINEFEPVEYNHLIAEMTDFSVVWQASDGSRRIMSSDKLQKIKNECCGKKAVLKKIERKEKKKKPPLLYDLTELQREANKQFGFSAKKTLNTAQSLYERHKLTTYPRTDSRYISSDMESTVPVRLKHLAEGRYSGTVKKILSSPLKLGKNIVNDAKISDHHAIIPTEIKMNPANLSTEEKQIYNLIVKRFIAVMMPDCKSQILTLVFDIAGHIFAAKLKSDLEPGWKILESEEDEDESLNIALESVKSLKPGQSFNIKSLSCKRLKTSSPSRYTEASLLTVMENPAKFIEDEEFKKTISGGLGTPATRADIIEKLLYNFYVERKNNSLMPTSKGCELIRIVPDILKRPLLTAQWERELSLIAAGKKSKNKFVENIIKNTEKLVETVKNSKEKINISDISDKECPVCGKPMLPRKGKGKNKILVCADRRCGYEMFPEDKSGGNKMKRTGKQRAIERNLVRKYGKDNREQGGTLGDLFGDLLN
ncbi:MAG: DNA topoisomerase III [Candidatus Cloacimonadota bacterium]|nr:MAG: DNA topoisomerase III [Candidatus Cloacimonadota bacterium]